MNIQNMVYPIAKHIIPPIYKLWLRKVEGLNNVPIDKPFIIAVNHSSYYDTLLLHTLIIPKINKNIHALVNRKYYDNFIIKGILNWGKCLPVFIGEKSKQATKNNTRNNKKTIIEALKCLKKNEVIEIFPEGGRSYDGKLKKAYNGVAALALKAKVPVLPIGIIGSYKVLPKGKLFPRFKRCNVNIGKLMYFTKYYGKDYSEDKYEKTLESITRSIMKEIASLCNQEYNY